MKKSLNPTPPHLSKSRMVFSMKNITQLIIIVTILAISSSLCAIDLYVGNPVVPPGTGTINDPFESIAYALTQLQPEEDYCLVFMQGSYHNQDQHHINRQLGLRSYTNNPEDVIIAETFYFGPLSHILSFSGITFRGNNNNETIIHNSNLTIDNCIFEDYWVPLNFDEDISNVNISNSTFRNNEVAISDMNGNWSSRGTIYNCLFYGNNIAIELNGANLENCTIADNELANQGRFGANTYRNCILWGNGALNNGLPSVYYFCDTQSAVAGAHNISVNPRFEDPLNHLYTLKWDVNGPSPCIDAGDPHSGTDPDGTPKDMGYRYFPHEIETYNFNLTPERGIIWRCFPVVDTVSAPEGQYWNELGYMFRPYMGFNPFPILNKIFWSYVDWPHDGIMSYNGHQQWDNAFYQVTAPKGFILSFDAHNPLEDLIISGFRADPHTVPVQLSVTIDGSYFSNWVGYFVPYTQNVVASLSNLIPGGGGHTYLDYIYSMKTQTWSTSRQERILGSPWIVDPSRFTFSEGTMVMLELIEGAPSELFWACWGTPVDAYIRTAPTQFSYTEKVDYLPLYVELDPENMPQEIGVFVGGECIGAVVVDNEVMDINLYPESAKGDDEIELAFYYGTKGKAIKQDYQIYDPATYNFVPGSLRLSEIKDYGYISLKGNTDSETVTGIVKLNQNYPNPFNPSTQISFYLGKDLPVKLDIYNVRGQKVKTLCSTDLQKGTHSYTWQGDDQSGKAVSSGLYFYRLSTPTGVFSNKMLLMK